MQFNQKLSIIVELTKIIRDKSTDSLDIFEQISAIATEITNSARSSLYIYDASTQLLQTKVAEGTDQIIKVTLDQGIAGACAKGQRAIIENSVQDSNAFESSFDDETGFKTESTICVPVLSRSKQLLGVLQVLNKIDLIFNENDKDLLLIISELTASVIEDFKFTQALKDEVELKTKELRELNTSLEKRVSEEVSLNREKDQMLFAQSKLASMGEMFDAVAHQWRQPLSVMGIYALELEFFSDAPEPEAVREISTNLNQQIEHLNITLTEFRSFFRADKEARPFSIEKSYESVFKLIKPELLKYNIKVESVMELPCDILGMPNEFKHVLLNLFNNSKDAFIENNIETRLIKVDYNSEKRALTFQDNAGGICQSIIDKVFEANFTSHSESGGTGMGLYMSKLILDKMSADIKVDSEGDSTIFTLLF
jgi:signal transduction histidine kinase